MNGLQALESGLAAINYRVRQLEARVFRLEERRQVAQGRGDRIREAVDLAAKLALPGSVFWEGPASARRTLAKALRERRWSYQAIAHALNCSERTVERYFAPVKPAST